MSLKGKTDNIFQSPSQLLERDPSTIRLLQDRLLIRDLGEDERVGSIWIPQTAAERGVGGGGRYRLGIVVATGPGNAFIEAGVDDEGFVRRRLIQKPCEACTGTGRQSFNIREYQWVWCPECNPDGTYDFMEGLNGGPPSMAPIRVPCECKVGDKVIYDRRREAEVYFWGLRFTMCYEEQAVMCIVKE